MDVWIMDAGGMAGLIQKQKKEGVFESDKSKYNE